MESEDLVQQLLGIIKDKDIEIQRLSNLIFDRAGFIKSDTIVSDNDSSPTKIRTGKSSFADIKPRLEQMHRAKKPDWGQLAEEASRELSPKEIEILDLKDISDAKVS